MKKNYTRFLLIFIALAIFSTDGYNQSHILFVGRDNLGAYQSDVDLIDSLRSWGNTCEYIGSGTYEQGLDSAGNAIDYNNYDAIFINETVDSKSMRAFGSEAVDYPLPCINLEGYCVSESNERWAWLADAANELFQAASGEGTADDLVLVIGDDQHYITYNYTEGDEVAWSAATEADDIAAVRPVSIQEVNVTYDAKLGTILAQQTEADFYNFVAIDEIGGAGNKMIYWGLNHAGLNGVDQTKSLGTPAFFDLIKRSCEWAYEDAVVQSVEAPQFENLELVAFPNPASSYITVKYYVMNEASVTATLYNMAGQQVDVFTDMAKYGKNYLILDAKKYRSGIYNLKLDTGSETAFTKVVVE